MRGGGRGVSWGLYACPLSAGSRGPKATWILQASLGERTQEKRLERQEEGQSRGGEGPEQQGPKLLDPWEGGVAPCAGLVTLFLSQIVRVLVMEATFSTATPSPKQSWDPVLQTGLQDAIPGLCGGSVVSTRTWGSGSSLSQTTEGLLLLLFFFVLLSLTRGYFSSDV